MTSSPGVRPRGSLPGSTGTSAPDGTPDSLGERLRAHRTEVGISLRELARRIEVSPSLVSQIETGKVQPSVGTLYAIVTELEASFDDLLFGDEAGVSDGRGSAALLAAVLTDEPAPTTVCRDQDRPTIRLDSGIRWERLTPAGPSAVEFLRVTYEPGAESCPPEAFQRHRGREWAHVVEGSLDIAVGVDRWTLHPGDSISYDASTPHRLWNDGDEPMHAIWFQVG